MNNTHSCRVCWLVQTDQMCAAAGVRLSGQRLNGSKVIAFASHGDLGKCRSLERTETS